MTLTDEQRALIVERVRQGNYLEMAAVAAGLDPELVDAYMRMGEEPGSPYADFRASVLKAQALAECDRVAMLLSTDDPKWIAWWLERIDPARWSQRVREAIEEDRREGISRLVGLESQIGRETLRLVLGALAGRTGEPSASGARPPGIH